MTLLAIAATERTSHPTVFWQTCFSKRIFILLEEIHCEVLWITATEKFCTLICQLLQFELNQLFIQTFKKFNHGYFNHIMIMLTYTWLAVRVVIDCLLKVVQDSFQKWSCSKIFKGMPNPFRGLSKVSSIVFLGFLGKWLFQFLSYSE